MKSQAALKSELKDQNFARKADCGADGANERTVKNWILGRYALRRHLVDWPNIRPRPNCRHDGEPSGSTTCSKDRGLWRKVFELAAWIGIDRAAGLSIRGLGKGSAGVSKVNGRSRLASRAPPRAAGPLQSIFGLTWRLGSTRSSGPCGIRWATRRRFEPSSSLSASPAAQRFLHAASPTLRPNIRGHL
jgi:hypothetical protein